MLTTPRDQIEDRNYPDARAKREKNNTYLMEVDNPLVVPVGKKVRIVTTANDVIHAWMVPALGVKQDAIPGFVRDTWFKAEKTGVYRGQCAELCGKDHGFMPIVVEVKSEADYAAWVDGKKKEMLAKQDDPNKEWSQLPTCRRVARRSTRPTAWPATRPTARACRGLPGARRLEGRARAAGPPDRPPAQRQGRYRHGVVQAALRYRAGGGHHVHPQCWGNKAEDDIVQPKEVLAPASKPAPAVPIRLFEHRTPIRSYVRSRS
jgi:cytochrome c oxidase subunit 2